MHPVSAWEHAAPKAATVVLTPGSTRRALTGLSAEATARVQVTFCAGADSALWKALHGG